MAGISTDSGDSLNIELNLVPFIDLLSSLVLFLLITAVWVQISSIPTAIDTKGEAMLTPPSPANLLVVHVTPDGFTLTWPATLADAANRPTQLAKTADGYDHGKLAAAVADLAQAESQPTTAVSSEDIVDYGEVIRTIDTLKQGGLANVALTAN